MTGATSPSAVERSDVRTIVGGGVILGVVTAINVTIFALASRVLDGTVETIAQAAMIVTGGAVFSYIPSVFVKPRSADSIAWATLVGLLGALSFTVIDTAILRPAHLYRWTWDAIGGGSGFWYIPVWWMGSAFLAWQGAMIVSAGARANPAASPAGRVLLTCGTAVVLFAVLTGVGAPFHSSVMALAFGIGIVVHAALSAVMDRR